MRALYSTLSLRYLRRRWFWAVLIVTSIALGVAMLAATQALNQTMVKAGISAGNPMAAGADLQVRNSDFGLPLELVDELRKAEIPGLDAVLPLIVQRVVLPELENRAVMLLGVDPQTRERAEDRWQIELKLAGF